jgi:hypothetical protein
MDLHSALVTSRPPEVVFGWVDDLGRYPSWMRLTHRVDPLPDDPAGPAWMVELRARVGPLARSKRLRMVRIEREALRRVVFERREADGRRHSPWVLTVELDDPGRDGPKGGTQLRVHLHYGGRLWTGGVLERVLAEEVELGRRRLSELLGDETR